jgi:hypothetical protein
VILLGFGQHRKRQVGFDASTQAQRAVVVFGDVAAFDFFGANHAVVHAAEADGQLAAWQKVDGPFAKGAAGLAVKPLANPACRANYG